MATQPRICIGVPVYNGGSLFAEMIESLLAQTFGDFEIFIADNCSTDDTAEVAQGFAERDRRVHYHGNATNIGASPNFNLHSNWPESATISSGRRTTISISQPTWKNAYRS